MIKLLKNKKAFGFVDSGVKILISVVIGALMLGGTYVLAKDTIMPSVETKVESMFEYSGNEAEVEKEHIKGDINDDGLLDETDHDIMVDELLSFSGEYEFSYLDINGDEQLDIMDLISLKLILESA